MKFFCLILVIVYSQVVAAQSARNDGQLRQVCGPFELFGRPNEQRSVAVSRLPKDRIILDIDSQTATELMQMEPPVETRGFGVYWAEPSCACIQYRELPAVRVFANVYTQPRALVGVPRSCWQPGKYPKRRV